MAYEFHYTPTGTGVISGKEVLEQTEDAINDLGNTAISGVQEALDKAEQALTNSENAVDDAQTALNTANNAEGVAIQAQNDVSNLSGTVANIGNRVTTAEGNIGNLQGRMTTAEGNITNLQGRMTTAEGNIGNLQTAVSTAQAIANSAQQTATTARQQSYVFRYSSTALVALSTNSNALLDNTDNLKVGDKVIDSSGVLFSITAIDTANSTFAIGTALVDLAQDSDVVHKSGNETITGIKTITDTNLEFKSTSGEYGVSAGDSGVIFKDKNNLQTFKIYSRVFSSGLDNNLVNFYLTQKVDNTYYTSNGIQLFANTGNKNAILRPILANNNADGLSVSLGDSNRRWQSVYATNYYYGSNNVEFSTKFVTTDTDQTISGNKTFSSNVNVYNSDTSASIPSLILKNSKAEKGGSSSDPQTIYFTDNVVHDLAIIRTQVGTNGQTILQFRTASIDSNNNNDVYSGFSIISYKNGIKAVSPYSDGNISLGTTNSKWSSVQTNKINSLEPSSLSLPSDRSARIDISSYFTDTSNGGVNRYTAPSNGFVYLAVTDVVTIHIFSQDLSRITNYGDTRGRASAGQIYAFLPVRKGDVFTSQWYTTATNVTLTSAYFIPCQGNV